ncbi:MAG: hypothetical protein ACI4OL_01375 [Gemmiger sp.]
MLPVREPAVRERLLHGHFGLEKENLRVDGQGRMAHTPHPFAEDAHIVRDFCENQTEINTPALPGARQAVESLVGYDKAIQRRLAQQTPREYLWPFSNPAFLRSEADVPVARFTGELAGKTAYREYLSDRYGRYKMTLCGIHVNFSFDEDLLAAAHAVAGKGWTMQEYKDHLYVELAEKAAAYGWLVTAVTAASPLTDQSYWEKGRQGGAAFCGMASVRCSELGYWNCFTPVFNYSGLDAYVDSIQRYLDDGMLRYATELYYPIRLKPAGENTLENLRQGVNHIELRMVDLNPLAPAGIDVRDVEFIHLFLLWLAAQPRRVLLARDQVQAVQNFKNAAHYDLKTVKIMMPNGRATSVADTALAVLEQMRDFYRDLLPDLLPVLDFERQKFIDPETRYAWIIRREYAGDFVAKGLAMARRNQENAHV